MSKHNRGKQKQERQVKEAQVKAKEAQTKEAQVKAKEAQTTQVTQYKTGQEPISKEIDSKGNPVLTQIDKDKIAKAKKAQVKAREAKNKALEAQREAKEALEELNNGGSGAIKALRQEIEAKIKAQEAKVEAKQAEHKVELDSLNDLYSEFKSLTGLDKTAKGKGQGKSKSKPNDNGRFNTTVKLNGNSLKVLVTHKESKAQFESSLYPANGSVKKDDWLALRHRFIAFFEESKHKAIADKSLPATEYNLTLRAYLSNLKGKIEAVKAII